MWFCCTALSLPYSSFAPVPVIYLPLLIYVLVILHSPLFRRISSGSFRFISLLALSPAPLCSPRLLPLSMSPIYKFLPQLTLSACLLFFFTLLISLQNILNSMCTCRNLITKS
jgi:hypothetical protein